MSTTVSAAPTPASFLTPDAQLQHWQGHRRLTRRLIEAFPEDQLFTFSIGGMRTFGEMALELEAMAEPMARGVATGDWNTSFKREAQTVIEAMKRRKAEEARAKGLSA